jgi:predicted site-specific integrase-resolvase
MVGRRSSIHSTSTITEAREELVEGLVTIFHMVGEKLAGRRGALVIGSYYSS